MRSYVCLTCIALLALSMWKMAWRWQKREVGDVFETLTEEREHRCVRKNGEYCIDEEGAWRYNPRGGRVVRMTPAGIRRCLAGKTIVITGDSRMRYMTLALMYMLTTGKFLKCPRCDKISEDIEPFDCVFICEKKVSSWSEFFRTTTKILNAFPNQIAKCDCYRPEPFDVTTTRENRYFTQRTPWGMIRIVYLQMFLANMTMRHDFPPFASEVDNPRCSPAECAISDERYSAEDGLRFVLRKMNVTHFYSSLGWLEKRDGSCLFQQLTKEFPNVSIYGIQNPIPTRRTKNRCATRWLALRTLTLGFPRSLRWDYWHYYSNGNEEMIHALISTICQKDSSNVVLAK